MITKKDKKAEAAETLTWVVVTVIIIVILALSIYAADLLTIPANLAGICSVSVPAGKIDKMPVGMQIMCGKGEEGKMLSIAKMIEDN